MSMTTESTPNKKRQVFDIHDHSYELIEPIGKGGQGVVWTTNFPNILVKIINKEVVEEKRNRWWRQIQHLMRQPLEGLAIAHPLTLITKPRAGYVMELMDGLEPLSKVMQKANDEGVDGYLATGGLQRRLKVLAKLARTLSELHGRGLAYGDISPANIFISQSVEHSEVWLIDADNIDSLSRDVFYSVTGDQPEYKNQVTYTPDYGAPEILRGESGINTLTDSWSFAVLAFSILTLAHPLKGDLVLDGEPEIEEAAMRGEFPWVDHPTDSSNTRSVGLPSDMVLEKSLRGLFERCFNAGMNDAGDRPSLNEWAEVFEMATKHCVQCQSCESSFIYSSEHICPFCEKSQNQDQIILLHEYFYTPPEIIWEELSEENKELLQKGCAVFSWNSLDDKSKEMIQKYCWTETGKMLVVTQQPIELKEYTSDSSCFKELPAYCSVRMIETGEPEIRPSGFKPVMLSRTGGKSVEIKKPYVFQKLKKIGKSGELHLGSIDSEHIVWQFIW
jgi:DNA-binding helix-hairpin-helix protein with protein kinase domain